MAISADESKEPCELQLLVIDLGQSLIVKVERDSTNVTLGQVGVDISAKALFGEDAVRIGTTVLSSKSFEDFRKIIDLNFSDAEPPIPRIEQASNGYQLITQPNKVENYTFMIPVPDFISQEGYDALCKIAGHSLVYEPKLQGTWTNIAREGSVSSDGSGVDIHLEIWRYTR